MVAMTVSADAIIVKQRTAFVVVIIGIYCL